MATTARIAQTGRRYRRRHYLRRNVSLALALFASLGTAPQAIAIEGDKAIAINGLIQEATVDTYLNEGEAAAINVISDELLFDGGAIANYEALPEADAVLEESETEPAGKVIKIDVPLAEVAIEEETAVIPDITRLTLGSFSLVEGEDSAADLLTLGDLSDMLDLRNMTVGAAVAGRHQRELQALTLDQYDFLADMTISEVADMAGLYSKTVGEIPIVEAAILTFLNHPVLMRERKVTLSRFLSQYPEIGSIKLGLLKLPEYHYSAIPKLLAVPITSVPDWQQLKVSSIVGLRNLPIHQNLQIEGEIATLTTARTEKRTEIQFIQDSGYVATWSEELNENALRPFNSFFLKPMIAGETIRIDAYFKSCAGSSMNCEFIGPFAYPNYKVGDSFYVSQSDWTLIATQDKQSIEFKREPAPITKEQTATASFEALLKVVAVGMLVVLAGGIPILLWLLSMNRKQAEL